MTILAISDRKYNPDPKQKRIKLKPKAWASLVTEVWERDNHACRNPSCRKYLNRNEINPHHIRTKGASGNDSLENIVCLCSSCHVKIDSGELKNDFKN